MAAESSFMKNNLHGSVQGEDGTGTPVTLALAYEKGNIKGGPLADFLNEAIKIVRRGKLISVAHGDRFWPKLSFSAFVGNVVGSSAIAPGTPTEFFTKKGAYSANVSTLGTGRPYAVNVKLTIEGTNFGDANDETLLFKNFRGLLDFGEGVEGNEISIDGEVLGDIVVTNGANTVTYSQVS